MNKRTVYLAISQKTKRAVYERDGGECVYCHTMCGARPNAHFIPRSQGGLGCERNILTLCPVCHRRFDQGTGAQRLKMRHYFRDYLKACYQDWDERKLKYSYLKEEGKC